MPYEFFFSYTRTDSDDFLKQFFEDLSEAVRLKRGIRKGQVVGFFDQQDLELGEEWDPTLAQALQSSKVLVSLYSPGYFGSEYCGREWKVFHQRRQLYTKKKKETEGVEIMLPPVIKPVVWIPLRPGTNLPPLVQGPQFTTGDPAALHNSKGLRYMRKQFRNYETEYNEFIEKLSDEILDAADVYALPELPSLPNLKSVPSAFHDDPSSSHPSQVTPPKDGPKSVHFVYVAAKPSEIQEVKQQIECYLQDGGADWKPFFSENPESIGVLAQRVASNKELKFYSTELPFSDRLVEHILDAREKRRIVVLLVDSWTVILRGYRKILEAFDERNYFNCSVLIPWNSDVETQQQREQLEQTIRQTFNYRASAPNPLYFRDAIYSEDEFCNQLREVLIRLKAEIINRADIQRPIPIGTEKPSISGPNNGSPK